jgi:RsiW-degrading membrane proteinase PrsW (M82 family)
MLTPILNIIAALLLGLAWLHFFRQVDGFERESWKASFVCLGLGLISPLLTLLISPFFDGVFDRESTDGLLAYALIQVAAVEELSKILPFLFILLKTDWVNESTDYVKYPAVSAIGFATTENILYAGDHGMEVLQYRAVLALPGHVFFSAVCGFFLYQAVKNKSRLRFQYLFFGFLIGVTAHGLYDFFLFTESALAIISIAMAGFFSYYIKKMLFYSLRDSEFFNADLLPEIFRAGRVLFGGMIFLFLFTAASSALISGDPESMLEYVKSNGAPALISTLILMSLLGLDEKGYRKVLGLPAKP